MSVYQLSHAALLTLGKRVVENSLSSDVIREAVARYRYDDAAFRAGRAQVEALEAALQVRQNRLSGQRSATEALKEARAAFHKKTYMPHVTLARLLFKDEAMRRRLSIAGRRPRRRDAYLQEARRFYVALANDTEAAAAMATRGVTTEEIAAAMAEHEGLERLVQRQEDALDAARQATQTQKTARRALARWIADYQKFARLALAATPQLLEQFGLRIPSK